MNQGAASRAGGGSRRDLAAREVRPCKSMQQPRATQITPWDGQAKGSHCPSNIPHVAGPAPTGGRRFHHLLRHRFKSYQLHSSLSLQSAPPFHSPSPPVLSPSASSLPPSRAVTPILIVLPACPHRRFRTRSGSEPQSQWLIFSSGLSFIPPSVSKQDD